MSRLSIRNLWKRYGDRTVLGHVSIEIEHREFCVVVDPRERAADGATLTYDIRLDHTDSGPAHVLGIAQPAFHAASVPAIAGKM